MEQRVLMLTKYLVFFVFIIVGCTNKEEVSKPFSSFVTSSQIPNDTLLSSNPNLKFENGIYYLNKMPYNGYIKVNYSDKQIKSIGSYLNGKQYGVTKTYFINGALKDKRSYKDGKSFGKQIGFWENGNKKYEFIYINDKREGIQKQWYESGNPYTFLTFKNDTEEGMQQAWRENGKIYSNYEAKNGARYGLQKAALCYTLIDQKIKME